MAKRRPTLAAGATIQRSLVRRHLRRQISVYGTKRADAWKAGYVAALQDLDAWLYAESARAKKPGGIGR